MSKHGGFKGGMPNIANLMKQAEKLQQDLAKKQQEAKELEFVATSGGGAVTVKVNGEKSVKEILIAKEVIDAEEIEMLQDLILVAVNEALKKAGDHMEEGIGALNLNGLM